MNSCSLLWKPRENVRMSSVDCSVFTDELVLWVPVKANKAWFLLCCSELSWSVIYRGRGWEGISPMCALPWCWQSTAWAIHMSSWCFPLHLPMDSCSAGSQIGLRNHVCSPLKNLEYKCRGESLHTVGFSCFLCFCLPCGSYRSCLW